jgi:flagellar biosynthesis protein FliQ
MTLLPKVVAVGLLAALFGTYAMNQCAGLFRDAIRAIPALVYGS